ncbi:MAG: class I SAM-dependent methyltransferase [Candidatus Helarchaeota archaeon]
MLINKKKWICPICNYEKYKKKKKITWRKMVFKNSKMYICKFCKTASIFPIPSEKYLSTINKNYWTIFASPNAFDKNIILKQTRSRYNYISKYVDAIYKKKILDIGSGFAYFFDIILEHYNKIYNYNVIETDKTIYNFLKKKNINKIYSNIEEILDNDYDLIIMSHILEHLPNPKEYLMKVKKCLKDKGILFIEVPNQDFLYLENLGLHLLSFNPKALKYLLKSIGFHIIDITTVGYSLKLLIPENKITTHLKEIFKKYLLPKISKNKYLKKKKFLEIFLYGKNRKKNINIDINSEMLESKSPNGKYIRILCIKNNL